MKYVTIATGMVLVALSGASMAQAQQSCRVVAWGSNTYGECNVPVPTAEFTGVSAGYGFSLGLKPDGTIVTWGRNDQGQRNVPSPNSSFVAVAAGYFHSLGLKSDGTIVAWGSNSYNQCNVPAPNSSFVAIAAGEAHSLGLKSDGTIVAWGRNDNGQCNVPSPNSSFAAIVAGGFHSLGLRSTGTIAGWGWNADGQCNVPAPNSNFVAIAAGHWHSLGLKSDGTIVAWGRNANGQCNVPSPNSDFVAVEAGAYHSLGFKPGGTILAWGYNADGECDVPSPNSGFLGASAGYTHNLGLKPTGSCCGTGGSCTVTLHENCTGTWTLGGVCEPNPCQSCVSVVAGTPVPAGGTYTVPLSTPDALTLEPIYAFTIDVYIDPTFLTLTGVSTTGTMTEGNGLFAWREISPGLIRVTWGGVAALAGPGVFANLILEESAESPCGECTPLDVRDILFNEGEPCALAVDGEFCVPTYAMQGQVTYFSCDGLDPVPPNPRGIPGVQVTRVRDCGLGAVDTLEVTTDGSGAYTLQGCPDCQDCLTPSLARSADSTAISSWDATLILRYVLLVDPLNLCIEEAAVYDPTGLGGEAICPPPSGFEAGLQLGPEYPGDLSDFQILPQKVVADVSRNHSVTAYDASLILKYRVGDPMGMASRAGEWDFYCASRCYAPGAAVTTADFVGLLNGDVSGDWSSGGFRSEPSGPPIVVTESIEPQGNRLWLVSLGVTGADGYLSGDYRLTVRQSDWELVQVRPAPLAGNSLVEGRLSQDELRVAMAGAQPVGDGAVVWITLRSRSEQPGSMPELIWAQINDGSRPVVLESASGVPELEAALPAGATMRVEPNPVRGEARLTFRVTEPRSCLLEIFAPDGRVVRRLTEGTRPAGVHAVEWDGRGEQGTALPSGVFFARLHLGEVQVEQRVVILR